MTTPSQSSRPSARRALAEDVVEPRWLAQSERPARLTDVDFSALPVALRLLLIHDGTLTTALEAHQLAPIVADVGEQRPEGLDEASARWLAAAPGDPAVRRHTLLRHRMSRRLLVRAEVVLLPDRLPPGFTRVLATSDKGLGAAFARMRIETRRELLWYGRSPLLGLSPEDARTAGTTGVSRGYRLIMGPTPVCWIEEIFPDAVVRGGAKG